MNFWEWLFAQPNKRIIELERELTVAETRTQVLRDTLNAKDSVIARWQNEAMTCKDKLVHQTLETANKNTVIRQLQSEVEQMTQRIKELQGRIEEAPVCPPVVPPTLAELPEIIRGFKAESAELPSAASASAWWDNRKALWVIFAKGKIQPHEDWSPDKVVAMINKFYNGSTPQHPVLDIPELSDGLYRVTTIANVRSIFESSFVGLIPYIADLHDCDDFARELMIHLNEYTLNTCFPVWGDSGWGYHAYNLVVCSDGLVMIEPQMTGHGGTVDDYFKVLPDIISMPNADWIPRKVRDI